MVEEKEMKECSETCDYCKKQFSAIDTQTYGSHLKKVTLYIRSPFFSNASVLGEEACDSCFSRIEKAIKTAYHTTRKEIMERNEKKEKN